MKWTKLTVNSSRIGYVLSKVQGEKRTVTQIYVLKIEFGERNCHYLSFKFGSGVNSEHQWKCIHVENNKFIWLVLQTACIQILNHFSTKSTSSPPTKIIEIEKRNTENIYECKYISSVEYFSVALLAIFYPYESIRSPFTHFISLHFITGSLSVFFYFLFFLFFNWHKLILFLTPNRNKTEQAAFAVDFRLT